MRLICHTTRSFPCNTYLHSEVWQSVFVPFEDLTQEDKYFEMTLTDLKQHTQYAYYIRTQLSLKHQDQLINVTQGQSQVKYFETFPDRPRPPIVRTKQKTNITITLEWNPSTPEHELIQKYFIDVYVLHDDVDEIDKRNYCRHPKENPDKKVGVIKAPEVICCRDQRAYLEFFQRDFNQTCGDADPSCELTYDFVLFHHHVEKALLKADLGEHLIPLIFLHPQHFLLFIFALTDKEPSQRYQYSYESHESPIHYKGTMEPIKRKFVSDRSKHYLHSHIIDNKHTESVVVPNLKPFKLYAFYVYACNNISNCSDYYLHTDRTVAFASADDIVIADFSDERWSDRSDVVTLVVQPPAEPNGVTVSYEVESFDYNRNVYKVNCVTRKEMEDMNYT